jgi:adenine C2-methylase RlmN of 23S rRNA A2503 and tRNA A37
MSNSEVNVDKVLQAFHHYMNKEGNKVTQNEFLKNINLKIEDADFIGDMNGLLRSDVNYDINSAYEFVKTNLLEKIND